jgi:sirohydrochlorin cobaltochelatase
VPARAVILFAHGARDARWSTTLGDLRQRVQALLPDAHVDIAFLELQPPALAAAIDGALAAGARSVEVVPVFWASGGHVANDVPALLAQIQESQPGVRVRLLPVLSELPGMLDFIADAVARAVD